MKTWIKKSLLILLCCTVFMVSMLRTQVQDNAYAFTGVEELAALGGLAAAAPVAVTVGTIALVAAGGIYVGVEYGDDIKAKSQQIWDSSSEATKAAWSAAVSESIAAGKGSIKITQEMADGLKAGMAGIGSWMSNLFASKHIASSATSSFDNLIYAPSAARYINSLTSSANDAAAYYMIDGVAYKTLRLEINSNTRSLILRGSIAITNYTGTGVATGNTNGLSWSYSKILADSATHGLGSSFAAGTYTKMADILTICAKYGVDIGLGYGDIPDKLAIEGKATADLDYLAQGVNEVNLALDEWLYQDSANGRLVEWNAGSNVWTHTDDGSVFTGTPRVVTPLPSVADPSGVTVSNPSVPIDDVIFGDTPAVGTPDTPVDGTLSGLWEWLKGILASILNAIKALAGLLGISALLETIIGWITSVAEGVGAIATTLTTGLVGSAENIQWEKLKMTAGVFTTKFPFSLPWDIQKALVAIFGGFNDSDSPPSWEYQMHVLGSEYKFTIGFPQLMISWSPFIKGTILVMFDIGLVYAVRKLLGGAS